MFVFCLTYSWTPAATQVPALPMGTPRNPFEVAHAERGTGSAPTANQRVAAAMPAPVAPLATPVAPLATPFAPAPTFNGASDSSHTPSFGAGKMIALGIACALLIGVMTFLITSMRTHRHSMTPPQDANALATGSSAPALVPPTVDAAVALGTNATDAAIATTPSDAALPPADVRPSRHVADPVTSKHVDRGEHASSIRGTDHTSPSGTPSGATGAANTGSASGSASASKKFNPDAIEE